MLISVRSFNTPEFVARRGARTKWRQSSDPPLGLELDLLSSLAIENRVISCAIVCSSYAAEIEIINLNVTL